MKFSPKAPKGPYGMYMVLVYLSKHTKYVTQHTVQKGCEFSNVRSQWVIGWCFLTAMQLEIFGFTLALYDNVSVFCWPQDWNTLNWPSLSFYLSSVEHDFRLQEGQVVRTWKVGDPVEGLPQPATPQPTTVQQQDSPQPVRPPASTKKNRKKCFWFLWVLTDETRDILIL